MKGWWGEICCGKAGLRGGEGSTRETFQMQQNNHFVKWCHPIYCKTKSKP